MFGLHQTELVWIFLIVLVLFGPKHLPKLANSIGRAVKDFKSGLSGFSNEMDEAEKAEKPAVEAKAETAPRPSEKTD